MAGRKVVAARRSAALAAGRAQHGERGRVAQQATPVAIAIASEAAFVPLLTKLNPRVAAAAMATSPTAAAAMTGPCRAMIALTSRVT